MSRETRFILRMICVCILLVACPAMATILSDWPDWESGKRTLKVFIKGGGAAFQAQVRTAIMDWNTANAGMNGWSFMEVASEAGADVTVQEGNPGTGNDGLSTPTTMATGLFGLGSGKLTHVDVAIRPGLSPPDFQLHVIMHELGHCLRLDHTSGNDVMDGSHTPPQTTPNATDLAEAKASDEDPPCPFAILSDTLNYLKKLVPTTVQLIPKPDSGIDLSGLLDVDITSLTGPDFTVNPTSIQWNSQRITAELTALSSASHNEVINVHLTYASSSADYTGVLTITPDDAPPAALPVAVAGADVTVPEGSVLILDGRGSYHQDPAVFWSGTWMTDAGKGLFSLSGPLLLPAGTYTATLQVRDYYGRVSTDSITVSVERQIPTLTAWGLLLMALLFALAAIVAMRFRRGRRLAAL